MGSSPFLRRVSWCLFFLTSALATAAGPKFKVPAPGVIALPNARTGQAYELDLKTLLADKGNAPRTWFITNQPAWLRLDNVNERVFGNPAAGDAGIFGFKIGVRDAVDGEPNRSAQVAVLAPPKWDGDRLDFGIANEGKTFSYDLKQHVIDPVGGGLTFEAKQLPDWLKLNATTGVLTGVPQRPNVGAYSGIQITARGVGGSAQTEGFGTVLKTVKEPSWVKKDFELPNAPEDTPYAQRLSDFALNPEGTPLTYEIVSQTPPPWLTISKTSGTISGTPKTDNIGATAVSVMLQTTIDGKVYTDTALFHFVVEHVNHPPKWLANPIRLPQGNTGVVYRQELGSSAFDPDKNEKLVFTIRTFTGPGPVWAAIDPQTGVLSGTAKAENVGENTWTIAVTDSGGLSDVATVTAKITKANEPPQWLAKPTQLRDGREDQDYSEDLTEYVRDPDSDPLTFSAIDIPAWLTLTPSGKLLGRPGAADVGLVNLTVRVTDNKSGADVADLRILVEHVNHAPYWILNPIQLSAKGETPMDIDISGYAKDDDAGDALAFSVVEGPPWAQLSATGRFTGTPKAGNEGENKYRVRVADRAGATSDVAVRIVVQHVNHAPTWSANPVTLRNAREGQEYAATLAEYASDADVGDRLTFTKLSGPAWLVVNGDGRVAGTPARKDLGINEMRVRVMDDAAEFAVTTIRVTVEQTNKPPRWRQNPILMTDGSEDTQYTFDLSPYAVDDDNDKLTYRLVGGPKWMTVSAAGIVSGVPSKDDFGPFAATFEVSDGTSAAQTRGNAKITHKNHPPVVSSNLPNLTVKERQIFQLNLNDPQYVSDPDGDKLSFSAVDALDWVTISPQGILRVAPTHKNLGENSFRFKVDDGQLATGGTLRITVTDAPQAPIWLDDPVRLDGNANVALAISVADKARDLDGKALSFAKKAGPAWLSIDKAGKLTGTPKSSDTGAQAFTVTACNDKLCTDGHVVVTVKAALLVQRFALGGPTPGARSAQLWIVDHSPTSAKLVGDVKASLDSFYTALDAGGIRSTTLVLSSDAHKWDGLPIRSNDPALTMSGDRLAELVGLRIDAAFSEGACGNCFNTPIWAFQRFLERLPQLGEVKRAIFIDGVPVDAFIVTTQRDHFPRFAKARPDLKGFASATYGEHFAKRFAKEGQGLRIHAITGNCPAYGETSGEKESIAPENAYQELVDATAGHLDDEVCGSEVGQAMRERATAATQRARLFARKTFKLSPKPARPDTIQVALKGKEGEEEIDTTAWRYDAKSGEIFVRWDWIEHGQLGSDPELRVTHEVD